MAHVKLRNENHSLCEWKALHESERKSKNGSVIDRLTWTAKGFTHDGKRRGRTYEFWQHWGQLRRHYWVFLFSSSRGSCSEGWTSSVWASGWVLSFLENQLLILSTSFFFPDFSPSELMITRLYKRRVATDQIVVNIRLNRLLDGGENL